MAGPNWRNVAAPDFSGSLDGIRTAGNLLDRAFATATGTLNNLDESMDERVNNEFQNRLLAYQDAEALKTALAADPSFGLDRRRIDGQSRALASGRVGQLLGQTLTEGQIRSNDLSYRTNERAFNQDVAYDDNIAPIAAEILNLRYAGKDAEADKLLGNLRASGAMKGVDGDKLLGLERSLFEAQRDNLGYRTSVLGLEQGRYNFGRQQLNDKQRDQAEAISAQLFRESADSADATARLDGIRNLDPAVYNAVRNQIGAPGLMDPLLSAAGGDINLSGGDADTGALRVMNYEAAGKGFKAVPQNIQTLGQFSDWAINLNNQGVKSSAMGVYQIVGQTMRGYAPKVLGKDWRNASLDDFNNQDAIAKAIFDDNKGSAAALRKQWVSLTPQEAEQIRKLPWEQARQVIARKESSSDPAALSGRDVGTLTGANQLGRAQALAQVSANPTFRGYYDNIGSTLDVTSAVRAAIDEGGAFSGGDMSGILDAVKTIQAQAQKKGLALNPAQAISIAANSTRDGKWYRGDFNALGFALSGKDDLYLDNGLVSENIAALADGGAEDAMLAQNSIAMAEQESGAALANRNAANKRYQEGLRRGWKPSDPRMQALAAEKAMADEVFLRTSTGQLRSPDNRSRGPNGRGSAPLQNFTITTPPTNGGGKTRSSSSLVNELLGTVRR
jgi:muramidase (phage lysozyme)